MDRQSISRRLSFEPDVLPSIARYNHLRTIHQMINDGMSPEGDRKEPTVEVEATTSPTTERPHNKNNLEEGQSESGSENSLTANEPMSHNSPNRKAQLLQT